MIVTGVTPNQSCSDLVGNHTSTKNDDSLLQLFPQVENKWSTKLWEHAGHKPSKNQLKLSTVIFFRIGVTLCLLILLILHNHIIYFHLLLSHSHSQTIIISVTTSL